MTTSSNKSKKPLVSFQSLSLLSAALLTMAIGGCTNISSRQDQPLADQRNLIDEVRISQGEINDGVDFEKLFYAGKHIFSNRFTSEDAYGAGPNAKRHLEQAFEDRAGYPFLRFNGLDSQSCLECHSASGFAPQNNFSKSQRKMRTAKQLGFTGGGAGFASNAFGFAHLACAESAEDCGTAPAGRGVIRNPPHAFGAGYVQTLAEEMTWDLQAQYEIAKSNPGTEVRLSSKEVDFGTIRVNAAGQIMDPSTLDGVSVDLVVRPFQWRGIASNLRNFIRDAMDFHFSVQPKELLEKKPEADDLDGVKDEILEGDISAVATFLAFLRPPIESSLGLKTQAVERGRELMGTVGCTGCHRPTLKLDSAIATIRDPRMDSSMMARSSFTALQKKGPDTPKSAGAFRFISQSYGPSPSILKYAALKGALEVGSTGSDVSKQKVKASNGISNSLKGLSRSLNEKNGPPETLPRLESAGSTVTVPLYSDLKRHKMGAELSERFPQSDDGDQEVPGDQFLTRPLWGVADTGPWMHDGRALTLIDAITMHAGEGSAANGSVNEFNSLSADDQLAIRTFLSSLRLPTVDSQ